MLKKEQTKKGAILEILPVIKDGLGDTKETLMITKECGRALGTDKLWGVPSGTRLEVVDGPRRRHGINTAIVKVLDNGIEGHVYWCELRASAKLVTPAT